MTVKTSLQVKWKIKQFVHFVDITYVYINLVCIQQFVQFDINESFSALHNFQIPFIVYMPTYLFKSSVCVKVQCKTGIREEEMEASKVQNVITAHLSGKSFDRSCALIVIGKII